MNTGASYERLPSELKARKQWVLAGADGSPCVSGADGLKRTSVHSVNEWYSFEEAIYYAEHYKVLIGFILTAEDPFCVIDLDVVDEESQTRKGQRIDPSKWSTANDLKRYQQIVDTFVTYTEVSRSGKGLHLWLKASIGKGVRRDNVEIYSTERFMICTGNSLFPSELKDGGQMLQTLVAEMRRPTHDIELVELEEELDDMVVIDQLMSQENADKFNTLCKGDFSGFPSQSEADLALLSMFAFISKSNEQCRRLFRMSELGKREKAQSNDYLNRALRVIRGRQHHESLSNAEAEQMARQLVAELQAAPSVRTSELASHATQIPEHDGGLAWPPGLAGAIAAFIYNSSPRPVKEVAIVATLGLLAGICGKAWSLPQTGLNMYIILVARSAVGKEAMHSGLSYILAKLRESTPQVQQFLDFNDFASGQALIKACATNSSFVNIAGEWGRKLKRLSCEDRADGPMSMLRTVMTNLYQKSGPASMVGGLTYSNKENNIGSVTGVAYSMIGETTPGTFYESLTESMMEDGFLSRFTIIEYIGDRPAANPYANPHLDDGLADALCGLVTQALTLLSRFTTCPVDFDTDARAILTAFDKECDREINSTNEEAWRQMWNRAHLKTLRISALLAVADNWVSPVVMPQHVQWALEVVRRDIKIMTTKLLSGDIGTTDSSRESKLITLIMEYFTQPIPESYAISDELKAAGIIPRKYLSMRTNKAQNFVNHRGGSIAALDITLKAMCDSGYIQEAKKETTANLGYHGKCYIILDRAAFMRRVKT